MKPLPYWRRGVQALVARRAGISPQRLSDILHRRRGVTVATAKRLGRATDDLVREARVPWIVWLENRETSHPAFYGKPTR